MAPATARSSSGERWERASSSSRTRTAGERKIAWSTKLGYVEEREPAATDKTFSSLVATAPAFRDIVETGLAVEMIANPPVKSVHDGDIDKAAPAFVQKLRKEPTDDAAKAQWNEDKRVNEQMVAAVATAIRSPYRVLTPPEERFASMADVRKAQHAVLDQDAYLPTEPDLPPEGTNLLKVIINPEAEKADQQSFYTYTCVLIALLQDSGFDATSQLPEKPTVPKDLHKAVFALHDYYVGKRKLQYDDGGSRMKIMGEWGYSLLWTGAAKWDDLPAHVELPAGDYIVDIDGHTLKLSVLKPIDAKTKITSIGEFFTDHSTTDNWDRSKTFKDATSVKAIWKRK